MRLKEELKNQIVALQKEYPQARSALIPALHLAQTQEGYLSLSIQQDVAALFHIEPNEVHAVVTFYDMFYEQPRGKHSIHVCKNISCMLRGADKLIEALGESTGAPCHHLSPDKEFIVIPSECLGACDRAPMMMIDDYIVGPVHLEEIPSILKEAQAKEAHHG